MDTALLLEIISSMLLSHPPFGQDIDCS